MYGSLRELCICCADSVETSRVAELTEYIKGLYGNELSTEQSHCDSVSVVLGPWLLYV